MANKLLLLYNVAEQMRQVGPNSKGCKNSQNITNKLSFKLVENNTIK